MKTGMPAINALMVCAAVVFSMTGLTAGQKTIIDYYRLLEKSRLSGSKFAFYRVKDRWMVKSPITDSELGPVVDIPGGYIQVSDPGTGGGTYTQETALFVTRSGAAYLGVNENTFNGVNFERAIHFYRYHGGKLVPDDTVLPAVEARLFFRSGYDASPVSEMVQIEYTLPRKGTTVIASLDTMMLERAALSGDYTPSEEKQSREALKNIVYKKIELNWDMEKGRFALGRKIK